MIVMSYHAHISAPHTAHYNILSNQKLTTIKMLIQKPNKLLPPTTPVNQPLDIMHNIERIRPHITLCPTFVLSSPTAIAITSFHEPRGVVEDGEGCGEGSVKEEVGVGGFVEGGGEEGECVVVICVR